MRNEKGQFIKGHKGNFGNKFVLGYKHTDEAKKNMSDAQKRIGNKPPITRYWKGKKLSPESITKRTLSRKKYKPSIATKQKISKSQQGEKHYNWQGGISKETYGFDWTQILKRSIRKRDKYICQICNTAQYDTAHIVHHIDYNKKNNDPNNLVTLCRICHAKTNHNRKYWMNVFALRRAFLW